MTLYRCSAHGDSPSGRPWSFSFGVLSSASVATVEAAWSSELSAAWTDGTHGLETLFPTGVTVTLARTDQLAVVHIGAVDKLRVTGVADDVLTLAGTSTAAGLPEQNAVLVSLRTLTPGREGRGRIRLPAPDETIVTAGELGLTQATRVSTAIEALRASMGAAGHSIVLITGKLTTLGTPVGATRVVTSVETDRIIRTVRMRNKSRTAIYA